MKKLLVLLLTVTAALSAFAFGCKDTGGNSNGHGRSNDMQQEIIDEGETCPDGNCEDMPSPELLPHMHKRRGDKLPPHTDPQPLPPPHHKK